MIRPEITERLLRCGFRQEAESWSATGAAAGTDREPTQRFIHPSEQKRGSVYVATNYLSATGPYKQLEEEAPRSSSDHKGGPVWQGTALRAVLDAIGRKYR